MSTIVDLSHEIPPQDVEYGTSRGRALLAAISERDRPHRRRRSRRRLGPHRRSPSSSDDRFLVGPDNGVLSPSLAGEWIARRVASDTADGIRHVPRARRVRSGGGASRDRHLDRCARRGRASTRSIRRTPEARRGDDGSVIGEVIAIDRFGNAISNLDRAARRTHRDRRPHACRSCERTPTRRVGDVIALVGSSGFVEIAQRDGSAARALEIARGTPVVLRPPGA